MSTSTSTYTYYLDKTARAYLILNLEGIAHKNSYRTKDKVLAAIAKMQAGLIRFIPS